MILYNETNEIYLLYDDEITMLIIKLDSEILNINDADIYERNNNIFYVLENLNIIWWEYDGNFYNLTCGFKISEHLDKIIENIK